MIVLAHRAPVSGYTWGVWLPPALGDTQPRSYYREGPAYHSGRGIMDLKGPDPSWEEWFENLGESPPYEDQWVEFEVPDGASAELAFSLAPVPYAA